MWVEELTIENVRCFERISIPFGGRSGPNKWTTLLSENGAGKSTVLQSLGIMLAGPEASLRLLPRPEGWLRDENKPGKLSIRIHKDADDRGTFGQERKRSAFGYSVHITGSKPLTIRNRTHSEPGIHVSADKVYGWLRQNAFAPQLSGWFAAGYGAFRRLTRTSQVIVPSLDVPDRYTNFITQFAEDEGLSAFERWLVYLDYREAKSRDVKARRQKELGVNAINALLPKGIRFSHVNEDGKIYFVVNGKDVPTISLSDGYRSVLALAGDLIWRLIVAFPGSNDPLKEHGVVLIDELDIHLHPVWQRHIAGWLRQQFPNIQFIASTHSPLVAAGAGEDATTIRMAVSPDGVASMNVAPKLFAKSVDAILESEAFGYLSPYAPATEAKLSRYQQLLAKPEPRAPAEEHEFQQLKLFVDENNVLAIEAFPPNIESRIERFLERHMKEAGEEQS